MDRTANQGRISVGNGSTLTELLFPYTASSRVGKTEQRIAADGYRSPEYTTKTVVRHRSLAAEVLRVLDTNAVDMTCRSSQIAFGASVVNTDASRSP